MISAAFKFDCLLNRSVAPIAPPYSSILSSAGLVRILDLGSGPITLVMVPDGPCVIEHFESLAKKLSSDYRGVIFDLPGFGFSKPSKGYDHSSERAIACIEEIFTQLKIKNAILNFSCVNGLYALAYAKLRPDRVSGIILAQTPSVLEMRHWVNRNIPRFLRIPLIGQLFAYLGRFKFAAVWFKFALPRNTDLETWESRSLSNLREGGCNCLASVVQGMQDTSDEFYVGVVAPVIAFWGSDDRSHRTTNPHSIQSLVPHADVRILKGVGHFPNLEKQDLLLHAIQEIAARVAT